MTVNGLCLVVTDKCNAACDICCFSCSPEKGSVMDAHLMADVIDQAEGIDGLKYIGFSGGEPFLYYDLIRDGLARAKAKGFATSVATNGFWGAWPDDVLFKRLSALAVDHIFLSTDLYHAQYVPDEAVGRAISAARALNINITVGIGETRSRSAGEHFRQMGDYKYLMNFYTYPFVRAGRAAALPTEEFFPPTAASREHCGASGLLSVLYDGRVFPCCEQQVFATALEIGSVLETPLKEIIASPDNSALMQCMRSERGFASLLEAAGVVPGACGACEACGRLFRKEGSLMAMLPRIREIAGQVAVDFLLGRCR